MMFDDEEGMDNFLARVSSYGSEWSTKHRRCKRVIGKSEVQNAFFFIIAVISGTSANERDDRSVFMSKAYLHEIEWSTDASLW